MFKKDLNKEEIAFIDDLIKKIGSDTLIIIYDDQDLKSTIKNWKYLKKEINKSYTKSYDYKIKFAKLILKHKKLDFYEILKERTKVCFDELYHNSYTLSSSVEFNIFKTNNSKFLSSFGLMQTQSLFNKSNPNSNNTNTTDKNQLEENEKYSKYKLTNNELQKTIEVFNKNFQKNLPINAKNKGQNDGKKFNDDEKTF